MARQGGAMQAAATDLQSRLLKLQADVKKVKPSYNQAQYAKLAGLAPTTVNGWFQRGGPAPQQFDLLWRLVDLLLEDVPHRRHERGREGRAKWSTLWELAHAPSPPTMVRPLRAHDHDATVAHQSSPTVQVWSVPPMRGNEVARPALVHSVTAALLPGERVGTRVGLVGGGGFGKTTLALQLARESSIIATFPDGVVWISLGPDVVGKRLADEIIRAARQLDPATPDSAHPGDAGRELARVVSSRRTLLIVDDVWRREQVEALRWTPGPRHETAATWLFTTRLRDILSSEDIELIPVPEMGDAEAASLLTTGLELSSRVVQVTNRVCGGYPLLLVLIRDLARRRLSAAVTADQAVERILDGLRRRGVTALDLHDTDQRHLAVSVTLDMSINELPPTYRPRFEELAVFSPGITVSGEVVARLWARTARWTTDQAEQLWERLFDWSLLVAYQDAPAQVQLHSVLADYLRERAADRLPGLHRTLLDAHRELGRTWSDIALRTDYMLSWLLWHLREAGLDEELRSLLRDRSWRATKMVGLGLAGVASDLTVAATSAEDTPRSARQLCDRLDTADVAAMMPLVGPELLAEMTTQGIWTVDLAIDAITRMADDEERSRSLQRLFESSGPAFSGDTVATAWRLVRELPRDHQLAALAALIPWLPDDHIRSAIDTTDRHARRSLDWEVLRAAVALVRRTFATGDRAFDPWRDLPDLAYQHKVVLTDLEAVLDGEPDAWQEVLRDVVTEVGNEFDRCQALAVLIPFLPANGVDGVIDVLRDCSSHYRGDALVALARWAPPHRHVDLLHLARASSWGRVPPESEHRRPLVELMRAVGPLTHPDTQQAALAVANGLHGVHAAQVIDAVAPHLDEAAARAAVNDLYVDGDWQLLGTWFAVAGLAAQLPDVPTALRGELTTFAAFGNDLRTLSLRRDPVLDQAAGLAAFASVLSGDVVRTVLTNVCRGLTWGDDDTEKAALGLGRLAPRLARDPELRQDVVTIVQEYVGRSPRTARTILATLAPHLLPADLRTLLHQVSGGRVEPAAFATLAALGRLLPAPARAELGQRGIRAADRIRDDEQRVRASSLLAPALASDSARLALDAIRAARRARFPVIVDALSRVVSHLAAVDLPTALDVVMCDLPSDGQGLRQFGRLFDDLDEPRAARVRRLYEECFAGSSADPRTWWMWEIAPHLPEPYIREAWAVARTMTAVDERRALMACLVRWLPRDERYAGVREILGLLTAEPNDDESQMEILVPLLAAGESEDVTEACRRLLVDLDPRGQEPIFIDLLAGLPDEMTDLALDIGARMLPEQRYEIIRVRAAQMPTVQAAELARELVSTEPADTGCELLEHARALIALSTCLESDRDRILTAVLERMTRRNWWSVYQAAFINLISTRELPAPLRAAAVTTALRQCFERHAVVGADDLIAVLDVGEIEEAFGELPRIRDQHARAAVLSRLMSRASDMIDDSPHLRTIDLPAYIPADCTPEELFAVITTSAWWLDGNGGEKAVLAVAVKILNIIESWLQTDPVQPT